MNYPAILLKRLKSRYGTNIFLQCSEISQSAIFNDVYSQYQQMVKAGQSSQMDKHNTSQSLVIFPVNIPTWMFQKHKGSAKQSW